MERKGVDSKVVVERRRESPRGMWKIARRVYGGPGGGDLELQWKKPAGSFLLLGHVSSHCHLCPPWVPAESRTPPELGPCGMHGGRR